MNQHAKRILVLNSGFQAVNIISVREAVQLLISEKAFPVEGIARLMRTVSRAYEVPSVISLNYYIKPPIRRVAVSKPNILRRDKFTCAYCGVKAGDRRRGKLYVRSDFSVDHIYPKSRGGQNTWLNLICACKPCNEKKDDKTLAACGMNLLFQPAKPKETTFTFTGNYPEAWEKYL